MRRKQGRPFGSPGKRAVLHEQRQKRKTLLLRIIARSVNKYGCQPSYRELAESLGYFSTGYVQLLIKEMERDKLVVSMGARALSFKWRDYL